MKITVEHKGTKIIVDENVVPAPDKVVTMRYSDQNKLIQETIIVMCEQVRKLREIKEK